jgi:hypothetical protein
MTSAAKVMGPALARAGLPRHACGTEQGGAIGNRWVTSLEWGWLKHLSVGDLRAGKWSRNGRDAALRKGTVH